MSNLLSDLRKIALAMALCGPCLAQSPAVIEECESCHGAGGVSQWPDMPTIAGISAPVLADALGAYRDSVRPCLTSGYRLGDTSRAATDMCAVSRALSDAELEAIAEHFAAQPFAPASQVTDPAKVARGKELHDRNCEICHAGGGADPATDASILAGQWMDYLARSFAEFRSGEREQPPPMKFLLDPLSDADIEALVHYYGSQQ